jgi:anaerobic selenocysteine-containing dehydrogenase
MDNSIFNPPPIENEEMKPENIPDLESLTGTVIEILEYLDTPEMIKQEKENKEAFDKHMEQKYEDFSLKNFNVFRLLLETRNREENIEKLLNVFSTLNKIKHGEADIYKEFESFREDRSEKYLYPTFGGKKGFEKAVTKHGIKTKKS